MNLRKVVVLAILVFSAAATMLGQSSSASMRGTITDPSGFVVANAQVSLANKATGFQLSQTTNASGEYSFLQIPPARYIAKVAGAGFAVQNKEVELLVNQPATLNFTLSVQASETIVEVSSEAALLNTTDASMGSAINNRTIEALPIEGRNVPDLLSLQPGVVWLGSQTSDQQGQDSRNGAVAGARSDQSNVTLDGIDNNEQVKGFAFSGVLRSTLDSVQEFRVSTTNSNADTGRSSGAQVVLVTKSGTNQFHGSAYEYNRNTYFAANDWFNKKAEVSSGLPNKPGQLIRNTFGATLGGPIRKDKLFFFLNYEGQRTAENLQSTLIVPSASFRQGIMRYPIDPSAGGGVQTLQAADLQAIDPGCSAAGTCPWGPGANPNALVILQSYPLPNGNLGDGGFNAGSFTWSAPNPEHLNTYIAKLDYAQSDRSRFFVRGNLLGDRHSFPPQFPGQAPSKSDTNSSKGVAVGHTWTINNNLINNFRYGHIREQLVERGAGNASFNNFNLFSPPVGENRSFLDTVPVHNFVDDVSWVKGHHTLQVGVNYRLVHNNTASDAASYNRGIMTPGLLNPAQLADTSNSQRTTSLDPTGFGYPMVNANFTANYDPEILALTGIVSWVIDNNNYQVAKGGASSSLLPTGTLIPREFKNNELEWYVMDSWRLKPNLTLTFGLRHTLLQTPWETRGQQVAPGLNMHDWFDTRGATAKQGLFGPVTQPLFSFSASGAANGGKPYWPMNKLNFAPRFSLAYSPNIWRSLFGGPGKTSIRAGAGMYYDHFGQGAVSEFSQYGSFGLTSTVSSPQNLYSPDDAPRITSLTAVPNIIAAPTPSQSYPVTPSSDIFGSGFAIAYGIDDRIKTPYSIVTDLSIQRELPGGFTLEAAYVGRLGRHLLQQVDIGAPRDMVDPKSRMDYYAASSILDQAHDAGKTTVSPIGFWENLFPNAAGGGNTATQNIYNEIFQLERGNDVANPFFLDVICSWPANTTLGGPCGPNGGLGYFWSPQWSSLYTWSSIGTSSYNAAQLVLRHQMSHGLQMDFGYTFAKSIDLGSDAERQTSGGAAGNTFSEILDAWNPRKNRGLSDFDTRHSITTSWVWQLPVGRGKLLAHDAHGIVEGLLGGWQLSGLGRWTSGFPFSVSYNRGWSTNWDFNSYMVQTAPIAMERHVDANGLVEVFADPSALQSTMSSGTPWRIPFAGEAGSRNNFRGDGFFGIDAGLSKGWRIGEGRELRFSWEVFNITNSVRFNTNPNPVVQGGSAGLDTGATSASLGEYSALLTKPRVQQFSLRFSF